MIALFCTVIGQTAIPGSGTQLADGMYHRSVTVTKSVYRTEVASVRQLEEHRFKSFDDAHVLLGYRTGCYRMVTALLRIFRSSE